MRSTGPKRRSAAPLVHNARTIHSTEHAVTLRPTLLALALALPAAAHADADTLVLGAAISLTGKYSTNGKNTQDGYDLAVKRINEKGGVKIGPKAYRIKVVYYDDESTSARGAQLVERLIGQDGVKFVLGPYSSGLTKAIAPVTEKYRIPMIEANGADRELFQQNYKYLFAVINTSDQYLSPAIDLAAEAAKKAGRDPKTLRVGVAIENDNFSQDVRAGVVEAAKRWGMNVVIDDKLPPDLNDMSSTIAKIKALKPDIMAVSGHTKGAALAVRQLADQRVNVSMLAMTHCDSAQVAEKFGKAAEYVICGSQWDRTLAYKDRWFGTAEDYAQAFEKEFKYTPPYQSAESTAAVLNYVDALERAQSLDPEKVRAAIAATDMTTLFGPIKYDANGKNVAKSMVMYQVQGGRYRVVSPSKWAAASVVFPTPTWDQRKP